MSTSILIIGESGTGKSTAIRTLDPASTFIINVLNKPLPFKEWKKQYKQDKNGFNYYVPDNHLIISKAMESISTKSPEIKTIIIDDFQYIMANEFMNRASEKGFDKFMEIAEHAWRILINAQGYRDDLTIIFLSHSEVGEDGKIRAKTIGKFLNEKISIEGMFTIVFQSLISDGNYYFKTNGDESTIAKSPLEMFNDKLIPNDLQLVINSVNKYNEEG
jgi:hypothetical protein